jgi:hypothetical protein
MLARYAVTLDLSAAAFDIRIRSKTTVLNREFSPSNDV